MIRLNNQFNTKLNSGFNLEIMKNHNRIGFTGFMVYIIISHNLDTPSKSYNK